MATVRRLLVALASLTALLAVALRLAYANGPYDILGEPHYVVLRCLGHSMLALGLWFMRWHYRRYLRHDFGPVAQRVKPLVHMIDPAVLAIAATMTLYAILPIFPSLLPIIAPVSVVAATVVWLVIAGIWRSRSTIAILLGRKS